MKGRAGGQAWGYVEPTEAAWEALAEAVEPFIGDMKRLLELGSEAAAVATCKGIVLGLYPLRNTTSGSVLEWAPDFPAETAGHAVSERVCGAGAQSARRDAVVDLADGAPEWADMIARAARPRARWTEGILSGAERLPAPSPSGTSRDPAFVTSVSLPRPCGHVTHAAIRGRPGPRGPEERLGGAVALLAARLRPRARVAEPLCLSPPLGTACRRVGRRPWT